MGHETSRTHWAISPSEIPGLTGKKTYWAKNNMLSDLRICRKASFITRANSLLATPLAIIG